MVSGHNKVQAKKLSLLQYLAYGTGHMLNVLTVAGMWYPYSVAYYEKVQQLSPDNVGILLFVSQISGAVFTLFIGTWSDNCKCYYGRRKLFNLIGLIATCCSFFFIWHDCFGCEGDTAGYKLLYYTSFAVVFQFGWVAIQLSHLALLPELTSEKSEKVGLNSIRWVQ